MGNHVVRVAMWVGLSAVVVLGCGGSKKKAKTGGDTTSLSGGGEMGELSVPNVDPTLCDTGGKRVSTFDLNKDGKPDVWKLFKNVDKGGTTTEVMTCKQVDLDHDGRKDYVMTFDDLGAMITEEFDFDFDGRFDARHYYDPKGGEAYLIERDSDYDKKPDIWEKYDPAGGLESVRRDRNGDGKPDVWEQYTSGQLMAILYDDDFDSRVDRKEEVQQSIAPATTPPPGEPGPETGGG